ncbi:MAG: competence protein [Gammaproteobacteria bacterium]|nr:competence protein [Gammaproteobacteria bacterium]
MPFIKEDIVRFKPNASSSKPFNLYWGEEVEVVGNSGGRTQIKVLERSIRPIVGSVKGKLPTQETRPLHFMMVDVQQGDGMVMVTPAGKKIFIDGGDNKLFARFIANRFRGTSKDNPLVVDAMIVSHGDADHFSGLNDIVKSEKNDVARKRIFIRPKRVYHNGIVKGPGTKNGKDVPDEKMFGKTVKLRGGGLAIVGLVEDISKVAASRLNRPFKRWQKSLIHWKKKGPIVFKRLAAGNVQEFSFLKSEGIKVETLGPIEKTVTVQGKRKKALEFFHKPPKDANLATAGFDPEGRAFDAGHTINGQSVSLRITYGNLRFFLSGDLNQESMSMLNKKYKKAEIQSEILKVPHHGSADFDLALLKKISPAISLISSGDESSRKEYIHPRATLLGALGKISRNAVSLIFSTELAAFFAYRGLSKTLDGKISSYHGFERTNFGIIHIRTDGERVLAFTHSGKQGMNEAYRLTVDSNHNVKMTSKVKKR